jgi:membrane protein YdbS with pleckstrin-like domain
VAFVDGTPNLLVDKRHIAWIVGLVSLMAIPIAIFFRRASPNWLALGSVGTMIHGSVVLIAAARTLVPRYALPIDVMVIIRGVELLIYQVTRAEEIAGAYGSFVLPEGV